VQLPRFCWSECWAPPGSGSCQLCGRSHLVMEAVLRLRAIRFTLLCVWPADGMTPHLQPTTTFWLNHNHASMVAMTAMTATTALCYHWHVRRTSGAVHAQLLYDTHEVPRFLFFFCYRWGVIPSAHEVPRYPGEPVVITAEVYRAYVRPPTHPRGCTHVVTHRRASQGCTEGEAHTGCDKHKLPALVMNVCKC
jgi:hypothetical protein